MVRLHELVKAQIPSVTVSLRSANFRPRASRAPVVWKERDSVGDGSMRRKKGDGTKTWECASRT